MVRRSVTCQVRKGAATAKSFAPECMHAPDIDTDARTRQHWAETRAEVQQGPVLVLLGHVEGPRLRVSSRSRARPRVRCPHRRGARPSPLDPLLFAPFSPLPPSAPPPFPLSPSSPLPPVPAGVTGAHEAARACEAARASAVAGTARVATPQGVVTADRLPEGSGPPERAIGRTGGLRTVGIGRRCLGAVGREEGRGPRSASPLGGART